MRVTYIIIIFYNLFLKFETQFRKLYILKTYINFRTCDHYVVIAVCFLIMFWMERQSMWDRLIGLMVGSRTFQNLDTKMILNL